MLCGLLRPSEGSVRVAGGSFDHGEQAVKSKVGYMSQKFTLYNDMTVEENLSFTASLRKLDKATYEQRRKELFDFISFDRPLNTIVRDLSGGTKQQVSLAASLLHDPEIIFLDEPTAGVTPAARSRFWKLIRKLAESSKTVFVTTHYMDEADKLCDRIAIVDHGKLVALDSPLKLKASIPGNNILEISFSDIPEGWAERLKGLPDVESVKAEDHVYRIGSNNGPRTTVALMEAAIRAVVAIIARAA